LLHIRHCLEFSVLHCSRFLVSPLPMVCRRPTMSEELSLTAHRLYALRVLHTNGMCDSALQTIFRSVVVAKLLYACSAWWGFTNATDQQRVNAFLRRSIRCSYCPPDLLPFEELCQAADQQLFVKILANSGHLLHGLLPPPTAASQTYNLRIRAHNRQLALHSGQLTDYNFLARILYANIN
jgi:hypothetical protein